ncbi:uncharacterized protein LOC112180687 [Rosa chinensis]|uniref:uncharacterized protein LOC112180687 n=1 Tax=Rosa chinensis TaxID=74649 RepID=UPI001AD8EC10|nr:uncharacterized protein LOC112180687 [Rosa chinensis]
MQKHLHIILLPLFLCVLVNTILISYSYSDCWNSVQSDCALNSVMAPKMRWTRSKRLLEEYEDENHNAEREVQEISNDQNVIKRTEDLYGCIKAVVPHHEVFVRSKNKMETKCEITLENLSREDVKITLWGDTAREFDLDAIYNLPPPVLANNQLHRAQITDA